VSHPHYGGGVTPKAGGKASQNKQGFKERKMANEITSGNEYIEVKVNGYRGEVNTETGKIGAMQTGKGCMPDANELRRYAEFIIALAKTSEIAIISYTARLEKEAK